ncbi:LapA family protein [Cellulophaga sp. F20128]|uniref:lipopolysaccharide assembly protein LapA domain-containing protein n=1 Tax=Cellulophaga sp. F20128 TaxID=2926413 RepID=UPI001FF5F14C|nr:LapA family protein [Cellulophaga sp. F20128]MCK0158460.1 LapA family protein [Cellulophaga sp. F20128]
MKFKTIIVLLFIGLIVIFSLQNAEVIDVKFFLWKISLSRVLIILGSFAIGVLVGILLSMKRKLYSKEVSQEESEA